MTDRSGKAAACPMVIVAVSHPAIAKARIASIQKGRPGKFRREFEGIGLRIVRSSPEQTPSSGVPWFAQRGGHTSALTSI
jgi:hypothetical protein